MPRTVKPTKSRRTREVEPHGLDDFFAGVDDVRAYLDRHLQDPARRRARLGKLVEELARRRSAEELLTWLTRSLREALGAQAAVALRRDSGWSVWAQDGQAVSVPSPAELSRRVSGAGASERSPLTMREGLLVTLAGYDQVLGALWLEQAQDLDPASRALLQAFVDNAGAGLEHALAVRSLRQDELTGLPHGDGFLSEVQTLLSDTAKRGGLVGVVALRASELPAQVQGLGGDAGRAALVALADAARGAFSGALLGRHFDDLYVLWAPPTSSDALDAVADRARRVASALLHVEGLSAGARSCRIVYDVLHPPLADASSVLAALELQLSADTRAGLHKVLR